MRLSTARYHDSLAKMLFDTDIYLKLPSEGYLGRGFTVYIDPMGAPGQTNARNYGSDYYVVISPGQGSDLKMEQIRHTYLHYLLDPLAMKYPLEVKRLQPLLAAVKAAPMDESFKEDPALLATECLIRAIEARTVGSRKAPDAQREQLVQKSEEQGFVLTGYFYSALVKFEKSPEGLRNAYEGMLADIDVGREQKRVSASPLCQARRPRGAAFGASGGETPADRIAAALRRGCGGRAEAGATGARREERRSGAGVVHLGAGCDHAPRHGRGAQLFSEGARSRARAERGGLVSYLPGKNLRFAGGPGGGSRSLPGGAQRRGRAAGSQSRGGTRDPATL